VVVNTARSVRAFSIPDDVFSALRFTTAIPIVNIVGSHWNFSGIKTGIKSEPLWHINLIQGLDG
jgi:hypothetical protein